MDIELATDRFGNAQLFGYADGVVETGPVWRTGGQAELISEMLGVGRDFFSAMMLRSVPFEKY